MKRLIWLYLLMLVFGLTVLVWPEKNDIMYIKLSDTHGPSRFDIAGILVILMAIGPMMREVWKNRFQIRQKTGNQNWLLLLTFSSVPLIIVAVALYMGSDLLLWSAVGVCVIAQAILIFFAFRKNGSFAKK